MSTKLPHSYFERMRKSFNNDMVKTWMWFRTANTALNGLSPLDACKAGRAEKVIKLIEERLMGCFK